MKNIIIAALFALASGFAWAASFQEVDADADGLISAEEAAAAGMDVSTVDTDGDGAVSQEEFDAAMGDSGDIAPITLEDLAGNWVAVQTAQVQSEGATIGELVLPGGAAIAGVTIWTFNADGSCDSQSVANIDGDIAVIPPGLTDCMITLGADGIGVITFTGSTGPSEIGIIVIEEDEIAALVTQPSVAVTAFTLKRQDLDDDDNDE